MKLIAKTKEVLLTNRAETIVEVSIAFVVLSIVMVLFAHGMNYATSAEKFSIDTTKDYDLALTSLLKNVSGHSQSDVTITGVDIDEPSILKLKGPEGVVYDDVLKLKKYSVTLPEGGDANTFYYYVFDAN